MHARFSKYFITQLALVKCSKEAVDEDNLFLTMVVHQMRAGRHIIGSYWPHVATLLLPRIWIYDRGNASFAPGVAEQDISVCSRCSWYQRRHVSKYLYSRPSTYSQQQLDKLVISQLGLLAQRRLARGVKLNHAEATVRSNECTTPQWL